ncbi:MAG: methyltransferase domain-containing protein [Calditrichia bacterium]
MDLNSHYTNELEELKKQYTLKNEIIRLNSFEINLIMPSDMDSLLEEYEKDFHVDERLPYWAHLWESSYCLGEKIVESYDFKDHHVLELGSGLGLCGLAATFKNGKVIYTDYDQNCFPFIRVNHIKTFNRMPEIRYLDWRDPADIGQFDWIIASDIIYEPGMYDFIISLFKRVLSNDGRLLLTEPARKFSQKFFSILEESFQYFKEELLYWDGEHDQVVHFYEIRKKH